MTLDIYDNPVWCERYRPKTIKGCILPAHLTKTFEEFINKKTIPNLLLSGQAGVGKTAVAKAVLQELDSHYVTFNGSLEVDKDTLRTEIKSFASSVSLLGAKRKYIILDEADYLSAVHVQPALRNFMEEYSEHVGFILTCNFKNRIIDPLHSRCSVIEFTIPAKEKPKIALRYLERCCHILQQEKVEYDKTVIVAIIKRFFPDLRRTINELQRYAATGKIDSGILATFPETVLDKVIQYMKERDFTKVRKWVAEHQDIEAPQLFRLLYDQASQIMETTSIPILVLILAKYQYQHSLVADPTINTSACMAEVMRDCRFK